jgi:hypothetical protein
VCHALYHCSAAYELHRSPEHWADKMPCKRFIMIQQRINHTYSWPKHWTDLLLVVLRLIISRKCASMHALYYHIASSHKIAVPRLRGCWWETSGASHTLDRCTPAAWELWGSPAGGRFCGTGAFSGRPPGAPKV